MGSLLGNQDFVSGSGEDRGFSAFLFWHLTHWLAQIWNSVICFNLLKTLHSLVLACSSAEVKKQKRTKHYCPQISQSNH